MRFEKWLRLFFIALVAIMVVMLVAPPAFASGDEAIAKSESSVGDQVLNPGDAIGVSLSYGMGDVDINEGKNCMGSEQKANIIWGSQRLALNPWCASLFYELNGRHEFAAKMRCDIPEVMAKYTSPEACVADQDLSPKQPEPGVVDVISIEHDEDIQGVQMAQVSLEERIQALEKKPVPRPAVTKSQQEPKYSDEQFDAVWAALKGDEDE